MSSTFAWPVTPPAGVVTGDAEAQNELLLGKDIFFDGDYRVNSSGDYVLIEGIDAFRAAILRRLLTRQGEFKARPEYGVGMMDFVKKRRRPGTLDEIRQRVIDQLSLDPRVEEVVDVLVAAIDDGIRLTVAVKANGQALRFQPFLFREASNENILSLSVRERIATR